MFWLLIWLATHISLGFSCFYLGYFAMVLLAMFTFPLLQTLVLILRFEKEKPGYWLLSYFPIVLSAGIIENISPIGIAIMYILFVEFILFLMSNKFGKFIFTTFSLFGLAIIYCLFETISFQSLDFETKLFFILFISSFSTGLGIEMHRWNIARATIDSEK